MSSCLPAYNYGGDPYASMNFDADLDRLQQERKSGGWFEDVIRTELLENSHRALLTIVPDPELEEEGLRAFMESILVSDETAPIDRGALEWAMRLTGGGGAISFD